MDEVRDTFRPSLARWLVGTAAGIGTLLLGIAGFLVMVGVAGDWGAWPLLLTAAAVLIVIGKWVETQGVQYRVTRDRLIIRRGILMKSIDEIELYRVKDVRMDYSLLNQMAGIGTICLRSSDETAQKSEFVMRHVPRAEGRREEFRNLVDAARRRRGVREIDMIHEDLDGFDSGHS